MRSLLLAAAVAVATAQGDTCPTYVRASVALNPGQGPMPNYDMWVNDRLYASNVPFRTVSDYISVKSGSVKLGLKAVGSTPSSPYVSVTSFTAPVNSFFTVGFTGPLAGPAGQVASNNNPIVNVDMRRIPNPARSSGLWYRWSETAATIDFRAVAGDPYNSYCNATCNSWLASPPGSGCPGCAITRARDEERISDLIAKTVIQLSEFEGSSYFSFYPTLVGKNDPLWNSRFNGGAGGVVGVRNLYIKGAVPITNGARGYWYDFWAQGDSLLTPGPNNLEVKATEVGVEYDGTNGCTFVLDANNVRIASVNGVASTNPDTVNKDANTALWIGFAFFFTATVVLGWLSYVRNLKPEGVLYYRLIVLINTVTALAYLIMALGGPGVTISAHDSIRQLEWVRYAAWALVAPITVVFFGLLSGGHYSTIIFVAFSSILAVAAGFAGAISDGNNATWPLFTAGVVVGFVPVVYALLVKFRRAAHTRHAEIGKLYDALAFFSAVLALGYVVVWGVSEGGFKASVDQEIITYTVLDILTKVLFGVVAIYSFESIARYGSWIGFNTGIELDFPIARSSYTGSGSAYATEPSPAVKFGEHREIAFERLYAATGVSRRA